MSVSKEEEFLGWLQHPVTKQYHLMLEEWGEALKEQWAAGSFQADSPVVTTSANASALGQMSLLRDLQELDYMRFAEILGNE